MTPELAQVFIAVITMLGGVFVARITAGKHKANGDDHELIIAQLKEDLEECSKERREEQAFYFRELFKRDRIIRQKKASD